MPSSDSLYLHTCDVMQKPPCKEVFHLQARGTCGMRSCKCPGWRIRSLACVKYLNVIFTNTNIPVTNLEKKSLLNDDPNISHKSQIFTFQILKELSAVLVFLN